MEVVVISGRSREEQVPFGAENKKGKSKSKL